MKIDAIWKNPIELQEGGKYIYQIPENVPEKTGCYIFYNQYGEKIRLIYIGKATNLARRVHGHFKSNVALMKEIAGTKTQYDNIFFKGNKTYKKVFPQKITIL